MYRCVLSSIMVDDPKPSRVSLGPVCDVVNLPIDDQPLVVPAAVALHLLPGVNTAGSPAARLSCPRQLASTSHLHCSFVSVCRFQGPVSTKSTPESKKWSFSPLVHQSDINSCNLKMCRGCNIHCKSFFNLLLCVLYPPG